MSDYKSPLVHTLKLSESLMAEVIYALMARLKELNARADPSSEAITNTHAALELARQAIKARGQE
jgi:hypothetical protein